MAVSSLMLTLQMSLSAKGQPETSKDSWSQEYMSNSRA